MLLAGSQGQATPRKTDRQRVREIEKETDRRAEGERESCLLHGFKRPVNCTGVIQEEKHCHKSIHNHNSSKSQSILIRD